MATEPESQNHQPKKESDNGTSTGGRVAESQERLFKRASESDRLRDGRSIEELVREANSRAARIRTG